ncbi:MAG: GNAT family N-acetyltransferase [Candidatus Hodarchaeales archaeon]
MDISPIKKIYKDNPSKFCFLMHDVLSEPDECEIKGLNFNPLTFAFRYKHIYILEGRDSLKNLIELQRPQKEVNIIYNPALQKEIRKYFTNLSISDPSGIGDTNTFLTMHMTQNSFNPLNVETETRPIQFKGNDEISSNVPTANKALLQSPDTISFIIKVDGEVVSLALSPNIYLGNGVKSFAILRGIWTDKRYRKKGFASSCISSLCNELFVRYNIQDIFIWVEENNSSAQKIYSQLGFFTKGRWLANKAYFIDKM